MNANVPAERKPQIVAGAPVAALVPQNLEEAFRLASAIAASGLAPRGLDKSEQIMVAIMAGAELGLAPFQSLQSFAVVNGRPTLWGDGLVAVVRARGVRIKEWTEGEGDAMVAHCEVTRPDTGETIPSAFSVPDAKKAGLWGKAGPWQQYPKRMLKARARAFALRDGCADMLRGIHIREEVEDFVEVRGAGAAEPTGMRARLEARPAIGGFDAAHVARELDGAQADAVIDGDFSEVSIERSTDEAEDDAFPGDKPVSRAAAEAKNPAADALAPGLKTGAQVLAERQAEKLPAKAEDAARRLEAAVTDATDRFVLEDDWAQAAEFRGQLAQHAPARMKAIEALFNSKMQELI